MEDIEDVFVKNPDTGKDVLVTSVEKYFYDMDSISDMIDSGQSLESLGESLGKTEKMDKCKLCGFVIPKWVDTSAQINHIWESHLNEYKLVPRWLDKIIRVMSFETPGNESGTRWRYSIMKSKDRDLRQNSTWIKYFKKDKCKFCGLVVQKGTIGRTEWEEIAMKHMDEKHKDSPYVKFDGRTCTKDFTYVANYFFAIRWQYLDKQRERERNTR